MVQAKLAEKREGRCDRTSKHAETRHYPRGVMMQLSMLGICQTQCWRWLSLVSAAVAPYLLSSSGYYRPSLS